MKRTSGLATVLSLALAVVASSPVDASGDDDLRILTYPTGIVVGELDIKVDLGPEGRPASLLLDGVEACTVTGARPHCTVDLGPDPHVHHLELRRSDGSSADRWINKPGQEAELELLVGSRDERNVCAARIAWAHPLKQDPAELMVAMDGRPLKISDNRHYTRFPCPPSQQPVVVASAVFADGRRVETAAVVGSFTEQTSVELAALPLVADAGFASSGATANEPTACRESGNAWLEDLGTGVRLDAEPGFEIVLVLDPDASYWNLYSSGWHAGRLPVLPSSAMVGQQIFRKGERVDEPKPKTAWLKAEKTLFNASRLWYVVPNEGLHRVNGFAAGRPDWLKLLFKFGTTEFKESPRIADAVAASGLVAGAGPQRAVVLILGSKVQERDQSRFSPLQVRQYLAEIGVPLFVLRNAKARDDGWPQGLANLNMEAMADNLELIHKLVTRQCLAWVPAERLAELLVEGLPSGVRLAGRDDDAPETSASAWARAEAEAAEAVALEAEETAPLSAALTESVDVTAVRILMSATGRGGHPYADLDASQIVPLEDGSEVTVLELIPLAQSSKTTAMSSAPGSGRLRSSGDAAAVNNAPELSTTVYVDRVIGGGADQRGALRAIREMSGRLTALGPVEIVARDLHGVSTILTPTRDEERIFRAIDDVRSSSRPTHAIKQIRRDFAERIAPIPDRVTREEVSSAEGGPVGSQAGAGVWFGAKTAASQEDLALSRAMRHLRRWATGQAEHRAGLLLVVGLGFDEDMGAYYLPFIDRHEPHNASLARADLRERRQSGAVDALARLLAGTGWRVLSIAGTVAGTADYAAESRTTRFQEHMSASNLGARTLQTSDQLLIDAIGTQRHLAAASGGDAVLGTKGLARALDGMSGWYLLTYQVPRSPDDEVHTLELRSTLPGVTISANRFVTDTKPEGRAEARVLQLLALGATGLTAQAPADGELPVTLELAPTTLIEGSLQSEVEMTVDLTPLIETLDRLGTVPDLLISVATAVPGAEPTVVHHRERLDDLLAGWIYSFPLAWRAGSNGRIAVRVQEMRTGLSGSAIALLESGS